MKKQKKRKKEKEVKMDGWMDEGWKEDDASYMASSEKSRELCAIQLIRNHGPEVRARMGENDDEDY